MIAAKHNRSAEWVFSRYIDHLMRRNFHALHLLGNMPEVSGDHPLLLLPNHSTWWDGFYVHLINRVLFRRKIYLMMLESQLSKYPFFSRVGAFGGNPQKFSDVRSLLKYSARILRSHTTKEPVLLCLFPQGVLEPWKNRSLVYKPGFLSMVKMSGTENVILQLAIKALFLNEQYPDVFFRFNDPETAGALSLNPLQSYREKHEDLLARLDRQIREGEQGKTILRGRQSLSHQHARSGN